MKAKSFFKPRHFFCLHFLLLTFLHSACNFINPSDEEPVLYIKATKEAGNSFSVYDLKSKKFLDSIYAGSSKINYADRLKYYLFCFNYYFNTVKDNTKALHYANAMLVLIEDNQLEKTFAGEYTRALFAKGDVLFASKDYVEGYHYYYRAQSQIKKSSDSCSAGGYNYRIGMILCKQEQYAEAVDFFKVSFIQSEHCGENFWSFYHRQELLNNIGICFSRSGRPDSASVYYDKALRLISYMQSRFQKEEKFLEIARGVVYGNQGVVALNKGHFNHAINLFKSSIAINSKAGNDNGDAQLARLHLAEVYLKINKLNTVRNLLFQVRSSLGPVENDNAKLLWNQLQSKYYYQKKDYQKAYDFLVQYNHFNDSVMRTSKTLKAINVNEQLSSFKTLKEIDVLKRDNILKKIWMIIAIIFLSMSLLIIFLILKNIRRSATSIKELSSLNSKIKAQKMQLENTLDELEDRDKEKDRIMRAVAHDLRNPLAGIESLISMLLESDTDSESAEILKLIRNTCTNSLDMITEILQAASPVNTDDSKKKLININTLISNCVNLMHYKAAEKDQIIHLELLDAPFKVFLNPGKISRVITNIISNAMKFTPIAGNIYINIALRTGGVIISIADEGIGIPDKFKDNIFDMFTPAKRLGTSGEKSFGLGLSISKQIVESNGGRIWFENRKGGGTIFFLELQQDYPNVTDLNSRELVSEQSDGTIE